TVIAAVSAAAGVKHPGLPTSFGSTCAMSKRRGNTSSRSAGSRSSTRRPLSATAGGTIPASTSPGPPRPWSRQRTTTPAHPQAYHHLLRRSPQPNHHPLLRNTDNPCRILSTRNPLHWRTSPHPRSPSITQHPPPVDLPLVSQNSTRSRSPHRTPPH